MTAIVMPDAVKLVLACLAASTDVTTLVGTRMATSSPKDTSKPWIRVSHIGGPRSTTAPMRLARRTVQIDAFAPPTPSSQAVKGDDGAMELALVAEACLFDAGGFATSYGVIAKVEETLGPINQPDTSRTPPTPRVHMTLAITIRPA